MKIGEVLRKGRRAADLGIRETAKQMGISHGTLSRIERGEEMSGAVLAKILLWLLSK